MAAPDPIVVPAATRITRLAAMLRNGFGAGLPRRRVDRSVLLDALARLVGTDESPDEKEITQRLKGWLAGPGAKLSTDAVTLRRALVDDGFLERDGLGKAYRRSRAHERHVRFEDAADAPTAPPGWRVDTVDGVPQLVRVYARKDFAAAMALAVAIGEAADAADHHPSLTVEWGRVTVRWWTHSAGGVTEKDVSMATRSDEIAARA